MNEVTHAISTFNNLEYLKLVLKSIEKNAYFKKVVVYAENCTDGTDNWLRQNYTPQQSTYDGTYSEPDVSFYIEKNEIPVGIGGGMNKCADLVKTDCINFLHSDMWVTRDFDLPLYEIVSNNSKTLACSWRIEPDIFGGCNRMGTTIAPIDAFGYVYNNFDCNSFDQWSQQFISDNNIQFRKTEGVSFMVKKADWDLVGGNDPLYAPASYEDHDLFLRMTALGFNFVETSKSVVFHFGARGSIFRGDDFTKRHPRQAKAEMDNIVKWVQKWKEYPTYDNQGFIVLTPTLKKRYTELYG